MSINAVGFIGPVWDPSAALPEVVEGAECTVWPGLVRDHGPYADGKYYKFVQLVGQPMCVSAYSKYQEEALAFYMYWFEEGPQWQWSDGGGGVASLRILNTDRFIEAAPWNLAVRDTINLQKDFWNVPVYNELMLTEGETMNGIFAGVITDVPTALDELAAKHDEVIATWSTTSPVAEEARG